jgi:hypothetical protein
MNAVMIINEMRNALSQLRNYSIEGRYPSTRELLHWVDKKLEKEEERKSHPVTNRSSLIELFMKGGAPYLLKYEYRKKSSPYRNEKPLIDQLIKEGLVTVVEKTSNSIMYQYNPKQ